MARQHSKPNLTARYAVLATVGTAPRGAV